MGWFWLSVTLGFLTLELATLQLACVWVALASLITTIVTILFENLSIPWQTAIFILLSLVFVFSTRPLVKKIKGKKDNKK